MRMIALAAVLSAVALATPDPSAAQQRGELVETFVCESENNGHNECRFRSQGTVTVHVQRQLSSSRCVFDRSWGTFDGGVWVDYGCRAEFAVRRPPDAGGRRPVGGAHQTITCESRNNAPRNCAVPGIVASTVFVERKLSGAPCIQGRSWGVSEGENSPAGIWVRNGCRATFSYRTGSGSYTPYGGTPHDFELPCESIRGQWNHCNVDQIQHARVELIAGNDACNAYKVWGVDDTGIWVRANCQGAFRVRYRH